MRTGRWGWLGTVAVLTLAAVPAGCDDDVNDGIDQGPVDPLPDDTNNTNGDGATAIDQAPLTDAQILRVVQLANQGEIDAGNIALIRGQTQAVRDYANRMISEHTAANERLNALAQRTGITFEESNLSRHLQRDHALMARTLNEVATNRFDLAYTDSQVAAHAKVSFLADTLIVPNVQNAELLAELNTLRGAVQDHLRQAVPLQEAQTAEVYPQLQPQQ